MSAIEAECVMGRVDASKAPCWACLMGGTLQRLANRATHIVVFGDGNTALGCTMHAKQYANGAGFAFKIPASFMWEPKTDAEMRDAMRFATYDRRESARQQERQASAPFVVEVRVKDLTKEPPELST